MAGLSRFLAILRLFDAAMPNRTVQEIADALGLPASTVYRTVRELVADGFLEPSTEAHYRLGSAFLEFDRVIRRADPLVRAGAPLLRGLVADAGLPCVALLARLYGDRVICAADDRTIPFAPPSSYERGRPMPLTRGATSKVILAQLPQKRLRRLLATEPGSGLDEEQLRGELSAIRRRGYCVARGEVDAGLAGIAVPVSDEEQAIAASLSLVVDAAALDEDAERRLVRALFEAARLAKEELLAKDPE